MSKNLYIPAIGDELILAEDWSLDLYYERRNKTLFQALGLDYIPPPYTRNRSGDLGPCAFAFLRRGTKLKVDRIYIRQRKHIFSSITFKVSGWPHDQVLITRKARFWAKLDNVNDMVIE